MNSLELRSLRDNYCLALRWFPNQRSLVTHFHKLHPDVDTARLDGYSDVVKFVEEPTWGIEIAVHGYNPAMVAHEAVHAAHRLHARLKRTHKLPDNSNREEFIAYFVGTIVDLYKLWRRYGFKDAYNFPQITFNKTCIFLETCTTEEFWDEI